MRERFIGKEEWGLCFGGCWRCGCGYGGGVLVDLIVGRKDEAGDCWIGFIGLRWKLVMEI